MSSKEISYVIQYDIETKNHSDDIDTIEKLLRKLKHNIPDIKILASGLTQNNNENKIIIPFQYKLFKLSDFFLSTSDRRNIFEPIIADWQQEFFEALEEKNIWKARWINFRYTYAFFIVMWKKASLFNLAEMKSKAIEKPEIQQKSIKELFVKKGLSIENQPVKYSIKLSKQERERLSKVFSSSQLLGELVNEDREER